MAAEFIALADLLRAPAVDIAARNAPAADVPARSAHDDAVVPEGAESGAELHVERVACEVRAVLREAKLFRARLADAFDEAAARLLRELASDVLARELRLAPCDLAAIVQRIAQRAPVLRVRVAPCDLASATALSRGDDAATVEDPALARGDAVVELAGGALDARLGVRLATVLEAFA